MLLRAQHEVMQGHLKEFVLICPGITVCCTQIRVPTLLAVSRKLSHAARQLLDLIVKILKFTDTHRAILTFVPCGITPGYLTAIQTGIPPGKQKTVLSVRNVS